MYNLLLPDIFMPNVDVSCGSDDLQAFTAFAGTRNILAVSPTDLFVLLLV